VPALANLITPLSDDYHRALWPIPDIKALP
jgi:hypothetical protein